MILEENPNIVITHHETDTEVEIREQLKRIDAIYQVGLIPRFIDFSSPEKSQTLTKKFNIK